MQLTGHMAKVRTVLVDYFLEAWRGKPCSGARRLAQEVAALCMMENRQHPQLVNDVRTALSRGPIGADRLRAILLPEVRDFRVAVVVEGTSSLGSVASLMDPVAAPVEIAAGEPAIGGGGFTTDLKALASLAEAASATHRDWSGDQAPGYMLLTFSVRTRDIGGAAALGRRQASESLDQYVAGQRIAEIRMRPETLAYDADTGRALRLTVPVLGSGLVRPLTTDWPPALRESLRTAHIARVTEAPMTAAGLCWAALEALEVKPGDCNKLARALSLQATRQQLVDLHQRVRTQVAATVRAARDAFDSAANSSAKWEASALAAVGAKAAALEANAKTARVAVLDRRAKLEWALEVESHRAAVDAWTRVKDDGKLRDPDRWLDVFAAPCGSEPELRAAADALAALADCLGGETGVRLQTWRAMLAAPASLAEWIEDNAKRFEENLSWLYVLRNTALHDGRFKTSTDMLDVHAGRALVDLTLEFLGNWYGPAVKSAPERADWTAIEVISHLAERQTTIAAKLRSGTRKHLNLGHLTSPTSTGWDRL
ncbi:hypothetical protein [Nocardia brasiliensis]|uniref:hypothetical protein n=1 Tax=Nocardia brasiliensis TaxID=37326 RepID=UPI002455CEBD|nr:hypothetical protein [Nocardia brasiliensis]